jgi:hypothetical protein
MKRALILALAVAALGWVPTAGAQTLTGTVAGKVADEQGGVLPGVTVTLTGRTGSKVEVTDAKGEFRFVALDPGEYTVKAELQGFRPKGQEGLNVSSGKTVEVSLALAVGGVTETVDVTARSVLIDTTTTASDNNLSPDLLLSMPLSHTAAQNLLNYAPGVNDNSAFGGAASSGNSLMLDGVDTRDPSGGTPWMFFNYNLVEEVQVGGIGQPAEYGGFSGAVVNTITKSGGNRLSFMAEARYTGDWLSSDNTSESLKAANPGLANPDVIKRLTDYTVQLGGPLKKDRVFYFFNVQRYSLKSDPTGPRTNYTEVSPRFNFKVNAQLTPKDLVSFSGQYDQYNINGRTGAIPAATATDIQTRFEEAPNFMWNAQYRKVFGSTAFLEAKFVGYSGYYDLTPFDMTPFHYNGTTGGYSGGAGWISKHDRGRNQLNVSVSKYAQAAGTHNFKFGVEIERSKVRDRFEYAGGLYFYDAAVYNELTKKYDPVPSYAYGYSYDLKSRNKRESFYAQDTWKVNRASFNLGVRADHIRGEDDTNGQQQYSTFSVAPRLGVVFDLTGKGTSVVRAFYGQLYDGAVSDTYSRVLTGLTDTTVWQVSNNWQTLTVDHVIPAVNKYRMGNDLKQPRTDEVSVAWEQQIGKTLKFSATGIYRSAKNFLNSQLFGDHAWTSVPNFAVNGWATPITLYKLPTRLTTPQYIIQNVDSVGFTIDGSPVTVEQSRKYRGLMLVLTRNKKDNWMAQVSYVLSKTDGDISNGSASGIYSSQFNTPNTALINVFGPAGYDRRHEIKVMASYTIPKVDLDVSGYYQGISGYNWTPYASINKRYTNYSGSLNVLLEPRGSEVLPFQNLLTLRAEKVFKFGPHRVGAYVDISNVFNSGTVTSVVTNVAGTSVLDTDVDYGVPTALLPARQVTIGVRWQF